MKKCSMKEINYTIYTVSVKTFVISVIKLRFWFRYSIKLRFRNTGHRVHPLHFTRKKTRGTNSVRQCI
jgi:hypothetical protein